MVSIYMYSLVVGDLSVYHLCIFAMNKDKIRDTTLISSAGESVLCSIKENFNNLCYLFLNPHTHRKSIIIFL